MKKVNHILCEKCQVGLVDVIILDEESDADWELLVHCDYCGGRSELASFHGLIQIAGTDMSDLIDYNPDETDVFFNVYTKKVVGIR